MHDFQLVNQHNALYTCAVLLISLRIFLSTGRFLILEFKQRHFGNTIFSLKLFSETKTYLPKALTSASLYNFSFMKHLTS